MNLRQRRQRSKKLVSLFQLLLTFYLFEFFIAVACKRDAADDQPSSDTGYKASSKWNQATSVVGNDNEKVHKEEVIAGMEIDIKHISLQRGQSYELVKGQNFPAIAYTNLKNGKTYKSIINCSIYGLQRAH